MTDHHDEALLDTIQRETFEYFLQHGNTGNGLVADSTQADSPASIAAVGFALTAYPVGVERGFMPRADALQASLRAARFFDEADQSGAPDGVGYKGFFYHFLDLATGRRTWNSELSTIDTALLLAGLLVAAEYFDRDTAAERELRERVQVIYRRVDWRWAQNSGRALSLGWKPESGFITYRWIGYSEALLLYALALGAPEHNIAADAYTAWTSGYKWKTIYGHEHVYAGPLFIHQFSHIWLDLRGIQDDYMAARAIDYFENSRRATYVQQQYAIRNPLGLKGYHGTCWGITASDGPGPTTRCIRGHRRKFYGYRARGAPYGPDDGTIAPWAAIASLPFAPEIVLPTIHHLRQLHSEQDGSAFGFKCSFNPTFPAKGKLGWISPYHFVLNQGPIVLMIENYRSGLVWRLCRGIRSLRDGLKRAGFHGGWLRASR